jgi:hypothetical protein
MGLSLGGLGSGGSGGGTGSGVAGVERWVYTMPGTAENRILTFADTDSDSFIELVADERVPVARSAPKGAEERFGRDWYPQLTTLLAEVLPMPEMTGTPAEAWVEAYSFRGSLPSLTHVRISGTLDEEEAKKAGLDPSLYLGGKSDVWLAVRNANGQMVDQRVYYAPSKPKDEGYPFRGEEWTVVEFPTELPPGSYEAEVLFVHDGKGARGELALEVPDYATAFGISTPVLSLAEDAPGGPALREASAARIASRTPQAGEAEDQGGSARPFVYGRYEIVPEVDPVLGSGDCLAIYFQVYNTTKATVEYDFWVDAVYAGSWDPDEVTPRKAEIVRLMELTDDYPEGEYEIIIKAKDDKTGSEVKNSVHFWFEK